MTKFVQYRPVIKDSAVNMVAMMMSTFITSFIRLLIDERYISTIPASVSRYVSTVSTIWMGMVIDVPQVDAEIISQEIRVPAFEGGDHLAERPDGLPDRDQLPLESVYPLKYRRIRLGDHRLFQHLDLLADLLKDTIVPVHHRVHQGIGEIPASSLPDASLPGADPLPDGIEDVSFPLLERYDHVRHEDNAHLL